MKSVFFAPVVTGLFSIMLLFFASISTLACHYDTQTIKVLFLGNSITHHGPLESIGWIGDWGMAASSKDKDYVHQLISKLEARYSSINFEFKEQNIAFWELDFNKNIDEYKDIAGYNPDILILRLGENVSEQYAKDNNYYASIVKLINNFYVDGCHVIVTGNFWASEYKDSIQEKVAIDNDYFFVDLSAVQGYENMALGKFENDGVSMHPSDIGMEGIANLLFNCITKNNILSNTHKN